MELSYNPESNFSLFHKCEFYLYIIISMQYNTSIWGISKIYLHGNSMYQCIFIRATQASKHLYPVGILRIESNYERVKIIL